MAAWMATDKASPFKPVEWFARRNPRFRHQVITGELGSYEGFRICDTRSGAFMAVLHSH